VPGFVTRPGGLSVSSLGTIAAVMTASSFAVKQTAQPARKGYFSPLPCSVIAAGFMGLLLFQATAGASFLPGMCASVLT
jgi:hypothetical protein